MAIKYPTEGSGKGDSYRPVDKKKYDESWERIFGHKKQYERKKKRDEKNNEKKSV